MKWPMGNWKEISMEALTVGDMRKIENSLLLENPAWLKRDRLGYSTKGTPRFIKCWGKKDSIVYVPRHFGNSKFPGAPYYLLHHVKWPETDWTPRPLQIDPFERLKKVKEGVVVLPCGFGKSIVALFFLQYLNQRALVLVPSRTLTKQWKDYFQEMFGTKSGVKIANSKDWKAGKYLTIATYQQVALHPLPEEFHKQFGVVIYDEIDVANAVQLSMALPKFNALRVGLTATKHRDDGMDVLSDLHVGPTVCNVTRMPDSVRPSIYVKDTGLVLRQSIDMPSAITEVSISADKEEQVLHLVRRALEKDRKVFVLCERIAQAENYHSTAREEGIDTSLAHAKLPKKDQDFSGKVIFATQMLGRGFNDEDLDTLIITGLFMYSPREFRQLLGRVQRVKEGKKRVVVVVMQDHHPILAYKLKDLLRSTNELYKEVLYF